MTEQKDVMDIEILSRSSLEELDSENTIKKVAVMGAGTMGQGISQLVASKGIDVILIERYKELVKIAEHKLAETMDAEIARWTMTESEKKAILSFECSVANYSPVSLENTEGLFSLQSDEVPPDCGELTATASASGYKSASKKISGKTTYINLSLLGEKSS